MYYFYKYYVLEDFSSKQTLKGRILILLTP